MPWCWRVSGGRPQGLLRAFLPVQTWARGHHLWPGSQLTRGPGAPCNGHTLTAPGAPSAPGLPPHQAVPRTVTSIPPLLCSQPSASLPSKEAPGPSQLPVAQTGPPPHCPRDRERTRAQHRQPEVFFQGLRSTVGAPCSPGSPGRTFCPATGKHRVGRRHLCSRGPASRILELWVYMGLHGNRPSKAHLPSRSRRHCFSPEPGHPQPPAPCREEGAGVSSADDPEQCDALGYLIPSRNPAGPPATQALHPQSSQGTTAALLPVL